MANTILKIIIFAILWIIGGFFFGGFGDAAGTSTSMLFIGESILGSDLNTDGNDLVQIIITFIITAVVYYIVAEIITYILMKVFGGKKN